MKIAQIVPSLFPQGPVRVALDLGQLLRQRGHELDFYYFDELEGAEKPGSAYPLSWRPPQFWSRYDVVHSHGFRPDLYTGIYQKRLPPTVHTLHNYLREDLGLQYGKFQTQIAEKIWKWACQNHAASVVLSRDMRAYYSQFWSHDRLRVIPNTRTAELSSQASRRQKIIQDWAGEQPVLISLSSASVLKNLEALLHFLEQYPEWRYVHVGGGELHPLQEKARKMGMEERCLWLGPQERGWEYLPAGDVFALPSRSEGFPLSLLEAVSLKVPALTSDLPVFRELFDYREVARFTLDDNDSLARAIEEVHQNGGPRAEQAYLRYQSDYSPEVVAKLYEDLYTQIT